MAINNENDETIYNDKLLNFSNGSDVKANNPPSVGLLILTTSLHGAT